MKTPYRAAQLLLIQFRIKRTMTNLNGLVEKLVEMKHLGQSCTPLYARWMKQVAICNREIDYLKYHERGMILKY